MATYAQISLLNIASNREGGISRNFEVRLMERDGQALSLPFDIEGSVEIQNGSQGEKPLKGIKASQLSFRIKTESALADKLISAETRQFYITVRETVQNIWKFEGYIQPNFHKYDIYKSVQVVELKATGELASLDRYDATTEKKTLKAVFSQINTELELTRQTDFYMRTRYNGQALSDPIPERIWMTELGKLGEDKGNRLQAIQQIAQEFNLQVFQLNGKLIVADAWERFTNPQAANVYRNGTTQETEDLLITLDESNVIGKIGDSDQNPTGKKEIRIGRVVQQRRLPQREQAAFPAQTLPKTITTTPVEIAYPGDFVAGDVVKISDVSGTAEITPGYMPGTYPQRITMTFELFQFEFTSANSGQSYYAIPGASEWQPGEQWLSDIHPFFELPASQQQNGYHYPVYNWTLPASELPPIPEDDRGSITIRIKKAFTISEPGVSVNEGYVEIKLNAFNVPITFVDTPDDLYRQAICTNAPGETEVFPLFESDYSDYAGEKGTMYIGVTGDTYANQEWIEEGTSNLVPFIELTARRKAELLLGSADLIHLKVRDTTPINLLNVLSFRGQNYAPVGIVEELLTGHQHIWMKPAPGLSYTYQSQFTYDPEELPAASSGPSRTWVTNRIYDAFATSLATGAIARTTASQGPGLINAFQIDRQNLLVTGDEIFIVDPFTLNRYEFTIEADQGASYTMDIEDKSVPTNIPSGSFIFSNARNILTGVLQSEYAFEVFSKINGVGVLTGAVSGVVKQLPVNLYTQVREGQTLAIAIQTQPDPIYVTVVAEVISNLSAELSGTITSIPLLSVSGTWPLADGEKIRLETPAGLKEVVTVDGAQTIDVNSTSITINQVTLTNTYPITTSWVRVDAEQAYDVGLQNLPIQEQFVDAPAGAVLMVSGLEIQSRLHVDPARILASVEEEKKADAIGIVAATVPNPPATAVTSISLDNIDEDVQLLDGQKLRILNKAGRNEEIVVNGDQLLVAPADTLTINSKTLNNEYTAGYAWVREPVYKITGRLTIEAGKVEANASNINDNASAVSSLTLTVDANGTAIASLETHTNISGGSSYSALTLRSDIDSANASITAAVDRVDTLETDTGTIIRSTTEPTTRPSGEPLQEGDIWLDPSTYDPAATPPTDNTVKQWNGTAWVDFNGVIRSTIAGLELDVNDYRARAMLYTDKNGNIGYLDIQSNEELSSITMNADQISFTTELMSIAGVCWIGEGVDSKQSEGRGVLIGTTAGGAPFLRAQFDYNDYVQMVGVNQSSANFFEAMLSGDIVFQISKDTGAQFITKGRAEVVGDSFKINEDGIQYVVDYTNSMRWVDALGGTVRARIWFDEPNSVLRINSESGQDIRMFASNADIRLFAGGYTIIDNLPTSNPGGTNRVWKNGSSLAIT